jgi:S1-C subfamily serine protease
LENYQASVLNARGINTLAGVVSDLIDILPTVVDRQIDLRKQVDLQLNKNLLMVNIRIENRTGQSLGSGVSFKYNGKFYILTAAHLADALTDELVLVENETDICQLSIVKQSKESDLMLLVPTIDITPTFYVELADKEPEVSEKFKVIGNPMGLNDIYHEAIVVKYQTKYMIGLGRSYFGNSGGGAYNSDGKLVGICSCMFVLTPDPQVPGYVLDGYIRLSVIKEFLAGIGDENEDRTNYSPTTSVNK